MGVLCPFIAYAIAQDPGPATFLLPTRDKAKEYFETKLDPVFQACAEIRSRMPDNPDDYTKLRMNFATMVLAMAWAGSDMQTTTTFSSRKILRTSTTGSRELEQNNLMKSIKRRTG
jgi:phage terminase large subunit GpA-like protein